MGYDDDVTEWHAFGGLVVGAGKHRCTLGVGISAGDRMGIR